MSVRDGAPNTNRTCDLPLRRGLLYPLSYRGAAGRNYLTRGMSTIIRAGDSHRKADMQERLLRIAAAAFAALALAWPAAAQWNSSAPVPVSPKSLVVESLRLGAGAPSTPLRLDPIDASLIEAAKADNGRTFFQRLQIGIGRPVDAGILARSTALRWVGVDGGLAARWLVTSPGARALRVRLSIARMDSAIRITFAGTAQANTAYSPLPAHEA